MTNEQLTAFFDFAGITFSEDPVTLRSLRKQLLLELKSSGKNTLVIGRKEYSGNDLVVLFAGHEQKGGTVFDPQQLLLAFPELQKLLRPAQLVEYSEFPELVREHADFAAFCKHEVQPRFDEFLRALQAHIKNEELESAAALLVFLELFTAERCFETERSVKMLLKNKFAAMKQQPVNDAMRRWFLNSYYYAILSAVADDDDDLLYEQFQLVENKLWEGTGLSNLIAIYRFQGGLPFVQRILTHIYTTLYRLEYSQRFEELDQSTRELLEDHSGKAAAPPSTSKRSEIIMILVIVFCSGLLLFVCERNPRKQEKQVPSYDIEFQPVYFPQEHPMDTAALRKVVEWNEYDQYR